jgi:hypothetical protein
MVLAGHVQDYPLAELLFYLSSKQRTGHLILKRREMRIIFVLRRGRLIAAQSIPSDRRLGEWLIEDGTISQEELQVALDFQKEHAQDQPLGMVLVDIGVVGGDAIRDAVRAQIADCLVRLFITPGGTFAFSTKANVPPGIDVDVVVEREVLDAIRRADEYVARQIDTSPLRLKPNIDADALQPFIIDNWDLIDALLGGAETVDEIVAETDWDRERVVTLLCQLQGSGAIDLAIALETPIAAAAS